MSSSRAAIFVSRRASALFTCFSNDWLSFPASPLIAAISVRSKSHFSSTLPFELSGRPRPTPGPGGVLAKSQVRSIGTNSRPISGDSVGQVWVQVCAWPFLRISYLWNAEHRELLLSGLRLATGEAA